VRRQDGLAVDLTPFLTDEALRKAGITDREAYGNDPDFARKAVPNTRPKVPSTI
jgi:hypothetical protein